MPRAVRRARVLLAALLVAAGMLLAPRPASATSPGYDGRIVFMRMGPNFTNPTVTSANPDGSGVTSLVPGAFPSFTGDGSHIAYMPAGEPQVYLGMMNADGSNQHVAIPNFDPMYGRISPDGTKVAFMTSYPPSDLNSGSVRLGIAYLDGSPTTYPFDRPTVGENRWAWSPDGSELAYTPGLGEPSIRIAGADGSNDRLIAAVPSQVGWLSFSPDGTQVAFDQSVFDPQTSTTSYKIDVVNVDGSGLHEVGSGALPAFSPDGKFIAFQNVTGPNESTIWEMNADGTNRRQITAGPDDELPEWQPRASAPANLPPRAFGTAQNKLPLALFGNAAASWDFDGTIVSYQWRWGDNTAMTPKEYAWHKYAQAGTYLVRLTVTDDDGARTTKSAWIKVS